MEGDVAQLLDFNKGVSLAVANLWMVFKHKVRAGQINNVQLLGCLDYVLWQTSKDGQRFS
ncbi:hypothetical protein OnM2_026049 [Erysiphe neolycopersici]|uniref:Uncharacterized protein n=1 Tax=Erysiphe neolycopersici TaxID=212602 RepID=A0A420I0Y4_9PEZI|nr:hypothetical protein OnM2_026049 [Erysiphe neolycopersici]